MTTIQTYTCPVHGPFDKVVHGEVPDEIVCGAYPCDCGSCDDCNDGDPCGERATWTPSAPAVHTPETRLRALTGHARDNNPW